MSKKLFASLAPLLLILVIVTSASAQVGKGLVDPNSAPEQELLKLPNMSPVIVKGIITNRPFPSITALNTFLLGQKLTQDQINAFYGRAFIHVNLNTGTREEIMLAIQDYQAGKFNAIPAGRVA